MQHSLIHVGSDITPGVHYLNKNESRFTYSHDSINLDISMYDLHAEEIKQYKKGKVRFSLATQDGSIFILTRFGTEPWGDAPFNIMLHHAENRRLNAEYQPGKRYGVTVTVQDTFVNKIKVLRYLTLSPEFSATLHQAIDAQLTMSLTPEQHDLNISRMYNRFPDSEKMLAVSIANSIGGE